ncbi:hypothetical protein [Saccharopolyspora pogona]|uniref:hypothetical protein n=1 Tax=Saccharopolyspora pogona TaxID=333966 RepID=UPI0016845D0C|nr:hypothetical protein [Saccharopolyspora pogona]
MAISLEIATHDARRDGSGLRRREAFGRDRLGQEVGFDFRVDHHLIVPDPESSRGRPALRMTPIRLRPR